ncbi:MAG: hypothetical protein BGP15_02260 [Sphingobacterium sp. 40-24]|nr:MAG: hypothetical protein BGP15_02260 [Sphingobacterium sp. 40-24]
MAKGSETSGGIIRPGSSAKSRREHCVWNPYRKGRKTVPPERSHRKETATQDITGDGRISVGSEKWQQTGFGIRSFATILFYLFT